MGTILTQAAVVTHSSRVQLRLDMLYHLQDILRMPTEGILKITSFCLLQVKRIVP
jgi:hypothetical protein